MKDILTDVTLIVDRSGSMGKNKEEAQNGINHFMNEQKKQDGRTNFTLVQFVTEYGFVYRARDIHDVTPYTLVPRGMTALLDAVGRAINEAGERFEKMEFDQRPDLVVFVIVTDGLDNSSHEFTKSSIKEMVDLQQNKYSWQFTYLGANHDAFVEAGGIGIDQGHTSNYTATNASSAFDAASKNIGRMKANTIDGAAVENFYTDEERAEMWKEK